ncbi:uncharacterized protein CEXT_80061 [Caerostris extrusa]|uniref:Uncharacterized protein n=1 Tax=Caerostris extrusa TaxID=172846 RepID=A0AAV4SYA8_CAEEX|nr:uncharacterized protein CEXT_80061 [Caerostris extrusa]
MLFLKLLSLILKIWWKKSTKTWSSITNIADEMLDFYHDLVNKIRYKINSFISGTTMTDADNSEIQEFSHKVNEGRSIIPDLVGKMESLTNTEELVRIIKNEMVTKLGINIAEEIIVFISKQGKYFNLQIVSDEKLSSRP